MRPTRYVRLGAVALVVLLAAPAFAESDVTEAHRRITRAVASPTPVGGISALSDQAAWRVTVPPESVVEVFARASSPTSIFYLRANRTLSGFWFPGPAASIVLDHAGDWRVEVDPAAGASVDISIAFRGYVAGQGGTPSRFSIEDAPPERGCVAAGVCLP